MKDFRLLDSIIKAFAKAAREEGDDDAADKAIKAWEDLKRGDDPMFVIKIKLNPVDKSEAVSANEVSKILKRFAKEIEESDRLPTSVKILNRDHKVLGFGGIRAEGLPPEEPICPTYLMD